MKFDHFYLSKSVETNFLEIRELILQLPFHISEVSSISPNSIIIASPSEIIQSYGTKHYMITENVIREMITLQIPEFPFYPHNHSINQRISLCFAPLWISCVGFKQDDVNDINRKVNLLGGVFSRTFSSNVTLLISETNVSRKVIESRVNEIPIVVKKWLDDCFFYTDRLPLTQDIIHVSAQSEQYLLPPYQGITFSSTDLTPSSRHELKRLAINGGGSWTDKYDSSVTYLIAERLTNTKKIELALLQKVPILRPTYLKDPSQFDVINWWCISSEKSSLFNGMIFSIHINCPGLLSLQDAIDAHGGVIGQSPTHIIVPHGFDQSKYANGNFESFRLVTADWIWDCINQKRIISVNDSLLYTPLPFKCPLPSLKNVAFYLSKSLNNDVRYSLANQIRVLGGIPVFNYTSNTKYLISETENNELIRIELKHNISSVSTQFLTQILKTGKVPSPSRFSIHQSKNKDSTNQVSTKIRNKLSKARKYPRNDQLGQKSEHNSSETNELDNFTHGLLHSSDEMRIEIKYDSDMIFETKKLNKFESEDEISTDDSDKTDLLIEAL